MEGSEAARLRFGGIAVVDERGRAGACDRR